MIGPHRKKLRATGHDDDHGVRVKAAGSPSPKFIRAQRCARKTSFQMQDEGTAPAGRNPEPGVMNRGVHPRHACTSGAKHNGGNLLPNRVLCILYQDTHNPRKISGHPDDTPARLINCAYHCTWEGVPPACIIYSVYTLTSDGHTFCASPVFSGFFRPADPARVPGGTHQVQINMIRYG